MKKQCERCKKEFVCDDQNISACDCQTIILNKEQTDLLKQNYQDCLCLNCLEELSVRVNSTKENE